MKKQTKEMAAQIKMPKLANKENNTGTGGGGGGGGGGGSGSGGYGNRVTKPWTKQRNMGCYAGLMATIQWASPTQRPPAPSKQKATSPKPLSTTSGGNTSKRISKGKKPHAS